MNRQPTLLDVNKAVALSNFDPLPAHRKMAPINRPLERPLSIPGSARLGAVLILLYNLNEALHLVLTRRRDDLNAHGGQISFPGGRNDNGESLAQTALRETYEEVGIHTEHLDLLGRMTRIYIPPSDYEVHPFVAYFQNGKRPFFTPNQSEVAEIIEVPVHHLMQPSTVRAEIWHIRGEERQIPFYDVAGHKVWGATAVMLSELLERLRQVTVDS